MEYCYKHYLKMKCRLWCITLVWLTVIIPAYSTCQGIDAVGLSVYPEGLVRVQQGQPLVIFCTTKNKADDIEFGIGGAKVISEIVNTTTRKLLKEKHKNGIFPYYCQNKVTNKLCPIRVLIDSLPAIDTFSCRSQNLDYLNCTWTQARRYSLTNYSLGFIFEGTHYPISSGNLRYDFFIWSAVSSNPRYKKVVQKLTMSLRLCNFFGCDEQNFTVDHFSIVKPNPPTNLKILGNGTHSVLLQWNIPNNMIDFLPHGVDHKIEYQIAKIDNTSYFRKVDTSGLPARNKTYEFLLNGLPYAHMQYEVRIYIRPKEATKDEFWSDFTYLVFYTASERPNRPPDTVVGAFDQNTFDKERRIYVYWVQLEEYEEAGANFTYKVVARQRTGNPRTVLADNKKSLNYVVLEDASLGAINVEICSTNDNGSSQNKSHLFIPSNSDTRALRVQSFTKLAYENGTYKLSWAGINNIDNYTVFWCQHNTTKICTGRMNFTILEPNKIDHVIDLPQENRYQFAISANNGTKTSGMVWATCDISKDAILMYGFPVKLDHGITGKSFAELTWTMACTLQEGIVTGYNITYCPIKNTSSVCDPTFNKSTVIISYPKQMAINITDLKPYRTYQFSLALNTTYGLKTIENAFTRVTTTEDTPTSPRNVKITEVESNSVVISWDPPLEPNGVINKYVIYNYNELYKVTNIIHFIEPYKVKAFSRISYKLGQLDAYSNYSLSVAACNIIPHICSRRNPPNGIFIRTRIGPPSEVNSLKISGELIEWKMPEKPGGPFDLYQISRFQFGAKPQEIIYNTTSLSYSFSDCEKGTIEEKYRVRAVNYESVDTIGKKAPFKQNSILVYPGQWTDPITVDCSNKNGFSTSFIVMAVIAGTAFIVVIVYELIKFYKRK